jgi:hypothetical protein
MKFRICLAIYYFTHKTNAEGAGMPHNSLRCGADGASIDELMLNEIVAPKVY